jgi:urease accessory protein
MTGGDRMQVEVAVQPGTDAVMTTQAAEKIYRSDGEETATDIRLRLEAEARLAWLPQEQILFNGVRFRRTLDVAMAADATLTLIESTVFGRLAMGERIGEGAFRDSWRVRRGGRLVLAEEVRLEGPVDALLARPAIACGGRAIATVLHVAPGAEGRREEARAALDGAAAECGVSAWDGILLARFLSPDPQALRADLARFVTRLRGAPMPRSWQT